MSDNWVPSVEGRYGEHAATQLRDSGAWHDDSVTQWLDHWAELEPGHPAISDGTKELDYGSLRSQSLKLAGWLQAQGVRRGDRVAIQLPNWSEFLVCYLAISRLGGVTVPIMTVYRKDEVHHILQNSGASVAITTGDFRGFDHAAMFRELRAEADVHVETLLLVRHAATAEPDEETFENALAAGTSADVDGHAPADDPHVVIYSSGTESTAKGCLHTWNTLAFTARALAHDVFRMTRDDTMFMPSPVAHSTGIVIGLVTPLLAGSSIHLQDVWEPAEALRRIERHRCTITATATPFVTMALQAAKSSTADLSSMRAWLCAGAPIPGSLAHEFEAVFVNARLLPLYGCTEILMATVCNLDDSVERIASSDGTAISEAVELSLVDETGSPVAAGQPGEILYRGPGAILGYWNDPERTRTVIDEDGWHHTGDLGVMSEDGYLRITGRVKDIIIRGGQNLSALEIESHLITHPGVREVAVVASPDDRLGEIVCAFVVPEGTEAPSVSDLRDYLTDVRGVAIQKSPERVVSVDELPMTASGKVQKYQLRDRLKGASA